MAIDLVIPIKKQLTDKEETLLKYFFRGLDKNMPWLNKVFLVLDTDTILPDWLNTKKLKLVYLSDFIPKDLLPTINLNTIELFEYKIPDLSENFIMADASFFAVDNLAIEDFFDSNTQKPILSFIPGHVLGMSTNTPDINDAITVKQYKEFIDSNATTCIKHARQNFIPCTKTAWNKLFKDYQDTILNSLTAEPDYKNYNKYLICYYGLANQLVIEDPAGLQEGIFKYNSLWAGIIKYDLLNNKNRKIICLDNIGLEIHKTAYQWIIEGLEYRLGKEKSKFEL